MKLTKKMQGRNKVYRLRDEALGIIPHERVSVRDYVACTEDGQVWYADLSPVVGSEQGGVRPVLVVQNDVGNRYSPTVIVGAITSKLDKAKLPTHVELSESTGLEKQSVLLLEQLRTIDKARLKTRIGEVNSSTMQKVNNALMISLGFFG